MTHEDRMLQEAIAALEAGQTAQARELLSRLLRADKNNATYWVYLSAVVDTAQERRFCLERALALDPENEAARRGLILLGERPPTGEVQPVRLAHPRAWADVDLPQEEGETNGLRRAGMTLLVGLAVVVIGLLGFGAYKLWDYYRPRTFPTPALLIYATPDLTATALAQATETPTPEVVFPTGEPTPLWMLLKATYTPTPLPVNTPHPIEAYRLGLSAYRHGRWQDTVTYMRQVVEASGGQAADAYYYLGEAYRQLGQPDKARVAYQKALELDPNLAPAYVGLARLRLQENPQAEVGDLLDAAIQADPRYGEGYLERARYRLSQGDPEGALDDLEVAEDLLPGFPLVALYRAQAYLALGDLEAARQAAEQAHRDVTLLPAYKVLAQVDLAQGKYAEARSLLLTYLQYQQDDAEAYYLLAQACRGVGDLKAALQANERARRLKPTWKDALLLQAQLLLEQEDPEAAQEAVNLLLPWQKRAPRDYALDFWLGRALFQAGKTGDAYWLFQAAVKAAEPESADYYQALYWRAKTLTALKSLDAAYRDWAAVAAAPADLVPRAWREEAQEQMAAIYTPTPGPTATATTTPTPTPTPTP